MEKYKSNINLPSSQVIDQINLSFPKVTSITGTSLKSPKTFSNDKCYFQPIPLFKDYIHNSCLCSKISFSVFLFHQFLLLLISLISLQSRPTLLSPLSPSSLSSPTSSPSPQNTREHPQITPDHPHNVPKFLQITQITSWLTGEQRAYKMTNSGQTIPPKLQFGLDAHEKKDNSFFCGRL